MRGEPDDNDNVSEGQLCERCHRREAEGERFVPGLGRLHLCGECATMLLASIMDSG
jgi:hypothetical protein